MPEEAQKVSMVFTNAKRMKHLFYISHEGDGVATEADEDTQQAVGEIRAGKQGLVQGHAVGFGSGVVEHSDFTGFLGMTHPEVRQIPPWSA